MTVRALWIDAQSSRCVAVGYTAHDNEGIKGDTLLCITLACEGERIADFEWVEVGKPYREWQVPADVLQPLISSIELVQE